MHNGVFFDLEEVVDFYNVGGGPNLDGGAALAGKKDPLMKPLNLTDDEKAALVAFLMALSSDEMPGKNYKIPRIPPDGIMTATGVLVELPEKVTSKKK